MTPKEFILQFIESQLTMDIGTQKGIKARKIFGIDFNYLLKELYHIYINAEKHVTPWEWLEALLEVFKQYNPRIEFEREFKVEEMKI